jgi:GDPmannose 4,6-dehydratase
MYRNNKKFKINKKSVLIFGITGQDGSLLAENYLKKNYKVFGALTRKRKNLKNLDKLKIMNKIILLNSTNVDKKKIEYLIKKSRCSIIYLLSGISSVKKSEDYKYETIISNNLILIETLEFLRLNNLKKIKVFNASSGEIFGDNPGKNTEESKINPLSYYALAKAISLEIARAYRRQFKLKIYNGILFNHESHLRPKSYVIKKLINGINNINNNKIKKLAVGNTKVYRDWGWAPEYIKIFYKIMKTPSPDDYIIATGKVTKLDNIVTKIFRHYKLKKNKYLKKSKYLNRVLEPLKISSNIKKLRQNIKCVPKISIDNIISMMIAEEKK